MVPRFCSGETWEASSISGSWNVLHIRWSYLVCYDHKYRLSLLTLALHQLDPSYCLLSFGSGGKTFHAEFVSVNELNLDSMVDNWTTRVSNNVISFSSKENTNQNCDKHLRPPFETVWEISQNRFSTKIHTFDERRRGDSVERRHDFL